MCSLLLVLWSDGKRGWDGADKGGDGVGGHVFANAKQGRMLGAETPKQSHYGLVLGLL